MIGRPGVMPCGRGYLDRPTRGSRHEGAVLPRRRCIRPDLPRLDPGRREVVTEPGYASIADAKDMHQRDGRALPIRTDEHRVDLGDEDFRIAGLVQHESRSASRPSCRGRTARGGTRQPRAVSPPGTPECGQGMIDGDQRCLVSRVVDEQIRHRVGIAVIAARVHVPFVDLLVTLSTMSGSAVAIDEAACVEREPVYPEHSGCRPSKMRTIGS